MRQSALSCCTRSRRRCGEGTWQYCVFPRNSLMSILWCTPRYRYLSTSTLSLCLNKTEVGDGKIVQTNDLHLGKGALQVDFWRLSIYAEVQQHSLARGLGEQDKEDIIFSCYLEWPSGLRNACYCMILLLVITLLNFS